RPFAEVLAELASRDSRICGVSCDCWGFLAPLAQKFPERAIELGIAEQNLIGVAAGLAVRGKIPFAIGMNPFVTMRCFEQIRTDLGYGRRNVKVIGGYGSGLSFAAWGATHHAMEEIALMRLIPEMKVIMPADLWETEHAVTAAAAMEGPFYIALAQGQLTERNQATEAAEQSRTFEVGKASVLRNGDAATVISTGPIVAEALGAAELLEAKGMSIRVLSMHTIKPIDREAIACAAQETPLIITLEEHSVVGGLGGAVAEVLADAGAGTPLKRLGLQDVFAVMSGGHSDFRDRFGMSAQAVADAVTSSR
ncbi:MAG: transketolase C-terminal domain-containing protein, partial [Planctomycetota bacterium]|nr:transketolase C-terminal domain-containing protein [Planctomycetota bacterium]